MDTSAPAHRRLQLPGRATTTGGAVEGGESQGTLSTATAAATLVVSSRKRNRKSRGDTNNSQSETLEETKNIVSESKRLLRSTANTTTVPLTEATKHLPASTTTNSSNINNNGDTSTNTPVSPPSPSKRKFFECMMESNNKASAGAGGGGAGAQHDDGNNTDDKDDNKRSSSTNVRTKQQETKRKRARKSKWRKQEIKEPAVLQAAVITHTCRNGIALDDVETSRPWKAVLQGLINPHLSYRRSQVCELLEFLSFCCGASALRGFPWEVICSTLLNILDGERDRIEDYVCEKCTNMKEKSKAAAAPTPDKVHLLLEETSEVHSNLFLGGIEDLQADLTASILKCFSLIFEYFPESPSYVCDIGGCRVLCESLENMEFLETAELTVSLLADHLVDACPKSCLEAGGLNAVLTKFDFFPLSVQAKCAVMAKGLLGWLAAAAAECANDRGERVCADEKVVCGSSSSQEYLTPTIISVLENLLGSQNKEVVLCACQIWLSVASLLPKEEDDEEEFETQEAETGEETASPSSHSPIGPHTLMCLLRCLGNMVDVYDEIKDIDSLKKFIDSSCGDFDVPPFGSSTEERDAIISLRDTETNGTEISTSSNSTLCFATELLVVLSELANRNWNLKCELIKESPFLLACVFAMMTKFKRVGVDHNMFEAVISVCVSLLPRRLITLETAFTSSSSSPSSQDVKETLLTSNPVSHKITIPDTNISCGFRLSLDRNEKRSQELFDVWSDKVEVLSYLLCLVIPLVEQLCDFSYSINDAVFLLPLVTGLQFCHKSVAGDTRLKGAINSLIRVCMSLLKPYKINQRRAFAIQAVWNLCQIDEEAVTSQFVKNGIFVNFQKIREKLLLLPAAQSSRATFSTHGGETTMSDVGETRRRGSIGGTASNIISRSEVFGFAAKGKVGCIVDWEALEVGLSERMEEIIDKAMDTEFEVLQRLRHIALLFESNEWVEGFKLLAEYLSVSSILTAFELNVTGLHAALTNCLIQDGVICGDDQLLMFIKSLLEDTALTKKYGGDGSIISTSSSMVVAKDSMVDVCDLNEWTCSVIENGLPRMCQKLVRGLVEVSLWWKSWPPSSPRPDIVCGTGCAKDRRYRVLGRCDDGLMLPLSEYEKIVMSTLEGEVDISNTLGSGKGSCCYEDYDDQFPCLPFEMSPTSGIYPRMRRAVKIIISPNYFMGDGTLNNIYPKHLLIDPPTILNALKTSFRFSVEPTCHISGITKLLGQYLLNSMKNERQKCSDELKKLEDATSHTNATSHTMEERDASSHTMEVNADRKQQQSSSVTTGAATAAATALSHYVDHLSSKEIEDLHKSIERPCLPLGGLMISGVKKRHVVSMTRQERDDYRHLLFGELVEDHEEEEEEEDDEEDEEEEDEEETSDEDEDDTSAAAEGGFSLYKANEVKFKSDKSPDPSSLVCVEEEKLNLESRQRRRRLSSSSSMESKRSSTHNRAAAPNNEATQKMKEERNGETPGDGETPGETPGGVTGRPTPSGEADGETQDGRDREMGEGKTGNGEMGDRDGKSGDGEVRDRDGKTGDGGMGERDGKLGDGVSFVENDRREKRLRDKLRFLDYWLGFEKPPVIELLYRGEPLRLNMAVMEALCNEDTKVLAVDLTQLRKAHKPRPLSEMKGVVIFEERKRKEGKALERQTVIAQRACKKLDGELYLRRSIWDLFPHNKDAKARDGNREDGTGDAAGDGIRDAAGDGIRDGTGEGGIRDGTGDGIRDGIRDGTGDGNRDSTRHGSDDTSDGREMTSMIELKKCEVENDEIKEDWIPLWGATHNFTFNLYPPHDQEGNVVCDDKANSKESDVCDKRGGDDVCDKRGGDDVCDKRGGDDVCDKRGDGVCDKRGDDDVCDKRGDDDVCDKRGDDDVCDKRDDDDVCNKRDGDVCEKRGGDDVCDKRDDDGVCDKRDDDGVCDNDVCDKRGGDDGNEKSKNVENESKGFEDQGRTTCAPGFWSVLRTGRLKADKGSTLFGAIRRFEDLSKKAAIHEGIRSTRGATTIVEDILVYICEVVKSKYAKQSPDLYASEFGGHGRRREFYLLELVTIIFNTIIEVLTSLLGAKDEIINFQTFADQISRLKKSCFNSETFSLMTVTLCLDPIRAISKKLPPKLISAIHQCPLLCSYSLRKDIFNLLTLDPNRLLQSHRVKFREALDFIGFGGNQTRSITTKQSRVSRRRRPSSTTTNAGLFTVLLSHAEQLKRMSEHQAKADFGGEMRRQQDLLHALDAAGFGARVKVRLHRRQILDAAFRLWEHLIDAIAATGIAPILEVDYFHEEGIGSGPTLEFFSTVARLVCRVKHPCRIVYETMIDGFIYPQPCGLRSDFFDLWMSNRIRKGSTTTNGPPSAAATKRGGAERDGDGNNSEGDGNNSEENDEERLAHRRSSFRETGKIDGSFEYEEDIDLRQIFGIDDPSFAIFSTWMLLGQLAAVAIQDNRLWDMRFHPLFLRMAKSPHFLSFGSKVSFHDLSLIDPVLFKSLKQIQTILKNGDEANNLDLNFTLPGGGPASGSVYELIPNGENVSVDGTNVEFYLQRIAEVILFEGILLSVFAFRLGFNLILPISHLELFSPMELSTRLISSTSTEPNHWTKEHLLASIIPSHGYTGDSTPFINFIQVLTELTLPQRQAFLRFATGTSVLPPMEGFSGLKPLMTVVKRVPESQGSTIDTYLPTVMTCSNYIKLPPYSSKDVLKERLLTAIQEGRDAFYLS